MSFISLPQDNPRIVPAEGDVNAKICIVGQAPGTEEVKKGRPFVGPAGGVLDHCLHAAGLIRNNCYITNLIKVRVHDNNMAPYFNDKVGFTEKGMEWVTALREEVNLLNCDIVIPLGNEAMFALLGWGKEKPKITSARGYIWKSPFVDKPILPSIHPSATLRGNYLWRYYIMHDIQKAKKIVNAETWKPVYRRVNVYSPGATDLEIAQFNINCAHLGTELVPIDFRDCLDTLHLIYCDAKEVSFDIEVNNFEVSCISIGIDNHNILEIDLCNPLITEDEELVLWRYVAKVLGNPNIKKVGQNLIFDIHMLAFKYGIITRGDLVDTMIGHSLIYPDFEKGLDFLASIYSDQPYWKNMVKFNNIKKES